MANPLRLVVSGKTFPAVSKHSLTESSRYYRALLGGNYKDSHETVYKFLGWSTKAFELLLQYILTGRIVLKRLKLDVIHAALEMSEYLVVDGFKVELSRMLVNAWTDLDTASAFQLAEEFGVMDALRENSFNKILSSVEKEQHPVSQGVNFDILILVSGMDNFWNYHNLMSEGYEDRWNRVTRRLREILGLAVKLPPYSSKTRALTRNLRIHWFNGPYRDEILQMLDCSQPVSKCLRSAFEEHLADTRQNVRSVFSHVRIPFDKRREGRGVLEFNMNNWCWEVKEFRDSLRGYQCVMNRDHATFLCKTGLFVIRKCNKFPKFIRNDEIGDIIFRSTHRSSCCVSGRFVFVLDYSDWDTIPTLYKYDIFNNEFSNCTTVPVERAKLKGHGDVLYIVGYSVNDSSALCVMEYKVKTNEVSVVVRSNDYGFPVVDLLVVKRKLYIFSNDAYTVVDTLQKEDQELKIYVYTGFFKDMWEFQILAITHNSNDIYFFLRVSTNSWWEFYLMVAYFNPVSREITCLCFIPTSSVDEYFHYECFDQFKPQIELRRPKDGEPCQTKDILTELKLF